MSSSQAWNNKRSPAWTQIEGSDRVKWIMNGSVVSTQILWLAKLTIANLIAKEDDENIAT